MTTLVLGAIPGLPLLGAVVLAAATWLAGTRLSRRWVTAVGVGSVALSALAALAVAVSFLSGSLAGSESFHREVLWTWWSIAGSSPEVALHLDGLSLVMVLVVTWVGLPILIFATEYMAVELAGSQVGEVDAGGVNGSEEHAGDRKADDEKPGKLDGAAYGRFFAAMDLFVAAMLVLVLADDLLVLYLGWEVVGLCSYLLIGFYFRRPESDRAARKAFLVTRIGDVALALGLCLLFTRLGTLRIPEVLARAGESWSVGDPVALLAAALLLGGAVGKSAQLPLHLWLPDAMAGPTPVSALIHAATMVTAGVYLVARTHSLFLLAPPVLEAVAWIGAATLLMAACAALAQDDIKRVLAWSTISQIGYMFLALGVGAFSAAIFHLLTHAFFKALLFLAAGAAILACSHRQTIGSMRGLGRGAPVVAWTFLVGAAALAGVPLITSGFYSKDLVLEHVRHHGLLLWGLGLLGVVLTALYIFRVVFLVFFPPAAAGASGARAGGPPPGAVEITHRPGLAMRLPLVFLALGALGVGWLETPAPLGGVHALGRVLEPVFAAPVAAGVSAGEAGMGAEGRAEGTGAGALVLDQLLPALLALGGIGLAWLWFSRRGRSVVDALGPRLTGLWARGWDYDTLVEVLVVRPVVRRGRGKEVDPLELLPDSVVRLARAGHRGISRTQTGRLRWYLSGLAAGAVLFLVLAVFGWGMFG